MNIDTGSRVSTTLPDKGPERIARIYVLGTMSVVANGDVPVTPRGKKARALLALLAMAPRGQRTRVWLRDKLWSMSDEKKSSTNLRQTVFELRRDLGKCASQALVIDRTTIGINLARVWVDAREIAERPELFRALALSPDTQLLEGLDVGDEEFEDWLQMERQIWYDKALGFAKAAPHAPAARPKPAVPREPERSVIHEALPAFSLGYLPNIQHGCDAMTRHLADNILEGIAKNLRELEPIAIFDFRDTTMQSDSLRNACEAEYYVRIRTLQLRDTISITFFLYRAVNMGLEWSQSIQAPLRDVVDNNGGLISGFISQNVDRLAQSLFLGSRSTPRGMECTNSVGFAALNMMFRLDDQALANSSALLESANRERPNSIYPALQAYLLSFKVGENLGTVQHGETSLVRKLITSTVGEGPFNSMSLACLGHVIGYVFNDHVVAAELLERALRLNPDQAFVWDHYALHKLYIGDRDAAFAAAKRAVQLGAYSPIRFSYDTTLCMAATLNGNFETAVIAGRSALGKQPRFAAALRYLTASYGHLGRMDDARETCKRLLQIDPDFEHPEIRRQRFRIVNAEAQDFVLSGIPQL